MLVLRIPVFISGEHTCEEKKPETRKKCPVCKRYREVSESLQHYRRVARAAASEMAIWITRNPDKMPKNETRRDDHRKWCEEQNDKKVYYTPAEGIVHRLAPDWPSWLCQQATSTVSRLFTSKDPERPTCARNFLVWAGSRLPPKLQFVPLPLQMTDNVKSITLPEHGRGATLEWDRKLGPVEVGFARKLDGYEWSIWQKIKSGEYELRTSKLFLHPNKGTLQLSLSYERDAVPQHKIDPARELEVCFSQDNPKQFIFMSLLSGKATLVDQITRREFSALGVMEKLRELDAQQERWKAAAEACPRNNKAKDAVNERRNRVTRNRDGVLKDWIGIWTKMVMDECQRRDCGKLIVKGIPKTLYGFSWQRAVFRFALEYKAKTRGIAIRFADDVSAEEALNEAAA